MKFCSCGIDMKLMNVNGQMKWVCPGCESETYYGNYEGDDEE